MAESTIDYTYEYPFQSSLTSQDRLEKFALATSKSGDHFPYFFNGTINNPHATANLLSNLARVVSTRYYIPPNMLNKILLERDPVITSGGGMLRFEGFSVCASTYARVDLTPESYKGSTTGVGTTNVDFNSATRNSLAKVRNSDRFQLAVGPDQFMVKHGFKSTIERKVKLPVRWIKGFIEVQAYQKKMEKFFRVDRANAIQFLRSIPKTTNNKSDYFVVQQRKGLRISQRQTKEAVKITGLKRLDSLVSLTPFIQSLTIYAEPNGESSEWQLDLGDIFFSLAITANVSRGFSGEGQVLSSLASQNIEQLANLRASLKWQNSIAQGKLQEELNLSEEQINDGLSILGSEGMVGYDLRESSYFHRELPFHLEESDSIHPRLKGATKLIDSNQVTLTQKNADILHGEVSSNGVIHKVKVGDEEYCTCPWFSKYQGKRGDCKHILAVKLYRNKEKQSTV